MTIVEMSVHMDCEGCQRKIRRALLKMKGVDNVDIDMVTQKVTVTGWVDQKKILRAVRKTGRTAVLWPYPYNVEYGRSYAQHHYHQHHQSCIHHHLSHMDRSYAAHPYSYASSSSYNYRKHGYDEAHTDGYYQMLLYSNVIDSKAGALFSDDNPNACSIM